MNGSFLLAVDNYGMVEWFCRELFYVFGINVLVALGIIIAIFF
jgi:hypothetical protein